LNTILSLLHGVCAATYIALALLIVVQARRSQTGLWLAAASLSTALWAASVAWYWWEPHEGLPAWLLLVRGVAWFGFLLHLYHRAVPGERALSPLAATIGLLVLLSLAAVPLLDMLSEESTSLFSLSIVARLGLAVANILLLENLYFNTEVAQRRKLGHLCIALGAIFVYDIVLYADAVLFRRISPGLFAGRASVTMLAAPLIAVAAVRNRGWEIDIHLSRRVAFHSATLIASGLFLIGLAAGGEILRQSGAEWGVVAEVSLISGGLLLVASLLASGRARSWLWGFIAENFFSYRYDYRQEWMRCIDTLSDADMPGGPQTRAIRAVAQIVDSTAGALFVRDSGSAVFQWAGSWNLPAASRPLTSDQPLAVRLQAEQAVRLDLGDVPLEGFADLQPLWLAVPLSHLGSLAGFIVLARGHGPAEPNSETTDLLGVVGRQVASHVVAQRSSQALSEARQLRDYSKRFAFLVHDIKNVSGQLSMLLSNAERHAANPAFQRDMLTTIRAAVSRISAMLEKLQRTREVPDGQRVISPADRLGAVIANSRERHGGEIRLEMDGGHANVVMDADAFDSLIAHLLDNAREAGQGRASSIVVSVRHEQFSVVIDIVDQGVGMTPEFIRDELFAPLRSTKRGGQGIGVFQARELLREAGGDLLAISKPGIGTTMRLLLPAVRLAPVGAMA